MLGVVVLDVKVYQFKIFSVPSAHILTVDISLVRLE